MNPLLGAFLAFSLFGLSVAGRQVTLRSKRATDESAVSDRDASSSAPNPTGLPRQIQLPPSNDTAAVHDANGKICILARLQADFIITYAVKEGGTKVARTSLPPTASVSGSCLRSDRTSILTFSWDKGKFSLSLTFSQDQTGLQWVVKSMSFGMDRSAHIFKRINLDGGFINMTTLPTKHFYATDLGSSYRCESSQIIEFPPRQDGSNIVLKLSGLQLQAMTGGRTFGAPKLCELDRHHIDERIPIAVGSMLALTTLLVFVGYAGYRHMKVKKVEYDTME